MGGRSAIVREVSLADAEPLHRLLARRGLAEFMSTPPTTLEEMKNFLRWSIDDRGKGQSMCFAITALGHEEAAGLIQVRLFDAVTAEWGVALGTAYHGTGVFQESAQLVLRFLFTDAGLMRLEARVATDNARAHGAMRKLGLVAEAILRGALRRDGSALDQVLWAINREDWQATAGTRTCTM